MNHTTARTGRTVPVSALAAIALMAALLTSALGSHAPAHAAAHSAAHETGHAVALSAHPHALTASEVAFHDRMRQLWEDHITWTRLAIVTFADGSAGFGATATRLLRNQTDIGDAIAPFYGTAAGDRLSALLHDHITIAVALLQAAKAGDTAAFGAAKDRWYANANDIADLVSSLDPAVWPQAELRSLMRTHLDQTLTEAADELAGDYAGSVAAYDEIHQHILVMADVLSDGIIRQFPDRFH
ncbi:MAG TPA: hypothetical protein VFM09_14560 [Marmoricola sp.]|nr:hypothetical protein [Marmoricola sp.]